ncbi:MAG: hypothetical protein ACYSWQ_19925 [Planctomycetota bacterium]|jgi:hypothetical protein
MHSDHEIFQRGISQNRKVKLTSTSEELGRELVSLCAPLYYSRGRDNADEPGCYYLWDFEATVGYNFVALAPSEIVSMELTEDSFELEEMRDSKQEAGNLRKGEDGTGR